MCLFCNLLTALRAFGVTEFEPCSTANVLLRDEADVDELCDQLMASASRIENDLSLVSPAQSEAEEDSDVDIESE